ncbi:MAG: VOC family protein [Phycisphaerae bacterium]|nr:VOC family protein [Saprospiraceae bacterium]
MKQIISYLTFNGNCREAMTFYQECLGGELFVQTIGESPMAEKLPPEMAGCILHSTLTQAELSLMASDIVSEKGLIRGNNISMMLNCSSEEEIKNAYAKLSTGGQTTHPLEETFWGALFGDLTDKFGNQWLLHFEKNTQDL